MQHLVGPMALARVVKPLRCVGPLGPYPTKARALRSSMPATSCVSPPGTLPRMEASKPYLETSFWKTRSDDKTLRKVEAPTLLGRPGAQGRAGLGGAGLASLVGLPIRLAVSRKQQKATAKACIREHQQPLLILLGSPGFIQRSFAASIKACRCPCPMPNTHRQRSRAVYWTIPAIKALPPLPASASASFGLETSASFGLETSGSAPRMG